MTQNSNQPQAVILQRFAAYIILAGAMLWEVVANLGQKSPVSVSFVALMVLWFGFYVLLEPGQNSRERKVISNSLYIAAGLTVMYLVWGFFF